MVNLPPELPKPPTPALKPVQQTVIELQIQYKGPRAKEMQQVARNKLAASNGSGASNHATVEAMHLSQYSRDILALGLPKHLVVWQPAASHCIWNPGLIICEWRVPEDSAFRRHLRAIAACTFDPKYYEDVMNRHCMQVHRIIY
ncbi:hypothetical protein EIP86_005757 [Pleurotus ostreatoroseus]|nr:hypothetical protein EIP86_005757 [Pleurotus ostreatoroseus]